MTETEYPSISWNIKEAFVPVTSTRDLLNFLGKTLDVWYTKEDGQDYIVGTGKFVHSRMYNTTLFNGTIYDESLWGENTYYMDFSDLTKIFMRKREDDTDNEHSDS